MLMIHQRCGSQNHVEDVKTDYWALLAFEFLIQLIFGISKKFPGGADATRRGPTLGDHTFSYKLCPEHIPDPKVHASIVHMVSSALASH